MAERIGARNGAGGAVLREIMRLGRNFWARRVWVDFRKVLCYKSFFVERMCLFDQGVCIPPLEPSPHGHVELTAGADAVRDRNLNFSLTQVDRDRVAGCNALWARHGNSVSFAIV